MNTNLRMRPAALLALCGALVGTHALAQSGNKTESRNEELKGSYDQPLPKKKRSADSASNSKTTMIATENGRTVSVTIENGKVSASIDGEEVPAERIKKTDDRVIILGKDGEELKSFNLSRGGGAGGWGGNAPLLREIPVEGMRWVAPGDTQPANAEPPPVMVGITMSDPDPLVLEHLGIDADAAFMIDRVVDGLPADKAGVKARDLVVALDGQKPATQEKFRELLRSKKPGEALELTVFRKGKEEKARIELVAYEREKLGVGMTRMPRDQTLQIVPRVRDNGELWLGVEGQPLHWSAEARAALEKALKEIKENPDLQPEKIKAQAERALNEALAALEESKNAFAKRFNNWRGWSFNEDGERPDAFFGPEGQKFTIPAPPHAPEANPEMSKRLERLTDQLDRLNRRLEEMERRMSEKQGDKR